MKVSFLRNNIDETILLSSTTYRTDYFDKCIYCHNDVENDYFAYNKEWYQPYRCNCEKAKQELNQKEKLLIELIQLQNNIDADKVNKTTKESIINEINRVYNENHESAILKHIYIGG